MITTVSALTLFLLLAPTAGAYYNFIQGTGGQCTISGTSAYVTSMTAATATEGIYITITYLE